MEDSAGPSTPINLIVVDTNILLGDSEAINELIKDNHLVIPWTVINELNHLKTSRDVGWLARNNLNKIRVLQDLQKIIKEKETVNLLESKNSKNLDGNFQPHPEDAHLNKKEFIFTEEEASHFFIHRNESYINLKDLDPKVPDNRIMATFNSLVRFHINNAKKTTKPVHPKNKKQLPVTDLPNKTKVVYQKIKLITNDTAMIILARELFQEYGGQVAVEPYRRNRVKPKLEPIKEILFQSNLFPGLAINRRFPIPLGFSRLKENDGILLTKGQEAWLAMRQGRQLLILDPELSVAGIKAQALNGSGYNWPQVLALHQLTNPLVKCVFLQGGAGTGKTLLAMAASIAQRNLYRKIVVIRPMIPLSDKDRMGFLPGGISDKTGPWLKPIEYNLDFIDQVITKNQIVLPEKKEAAYLSNKAKKRLKKNGGPPIENNEPQEFSLFEKYSIEVLPLDYIRGTTLPELCLIIDEAQNLTALQIKTIITRAGRGSKFIFTGDISQIDVDYLSEETSGMSHAIAKLHDRITGPGNPLIATTIFTDSLRSELAAFALEHL